MISDAALFRRADETGAPKPSDLNPTGERHAGEEGPDEEVHAREDAGNVRGHRNPEGLHEASVTERAVATGAASEGRGESIANSGGAASLPQDHAAGCFLYHGCDHDMPGHAPCDCVCTCGFSERSDGFDFDRAWISHTADGLRDLNRLMGDDLL